MYKHIATVAGIGLSVLFVVVFFAGRAETRHLAEVAPRVGMNYDDLLAMAPRVASHTGATLGTSRRVVYLLACSGLPTRNTLEEQATLAGSMAKQQRLSDREAVTAALTRSGHAAGAGKLKDC
jgi:protein-disulfide isomerase-like protein with CxxC motif